ncbi:CcdB family protein [Ciceribacter sp. L1K22]|uniref:CcdB family protein n=1 Tax=Ciceribacter sp. L1K22 TaxID=2820275 RepID=UPI001ABE5A0B|nr:CcdB family protein [Ciceribacter sp. L1K22]MBO3758641.1 CcdB family protein [Ciceribacter sp. L1K22]
MARFRVHRLKLGDQLVVDLQSDYLQDLPTRVVAPLQSVEDVSWVIARLTPRFEVGGKSYVMATHRLSALAVSDLGPSVADLSPRADEITAATDFLFQGF